MVFLRTETFFVGLLMLLNFPFGYKIARAGTGTDQSS